MRGLYINTQSDALSASVSFFSQFNHQLSEVFCGQQIELIYSQYEWPNGPPKVIVSEHLRAYCSGWFVYQGQRNNLAQLIEDYLTNGPQVFAAVSLGSFVIALVGSKNSVAPSNEQLADKVTLVVDALSLSTHYHRTANGMMEVAPSVKAFLNLGQPNPVLQSALDKQGHLFGNYTVYDDITRLEPAGETSLAGVTYQYYLPDFAHPDKDKLADIPQDIAELINYWPEHERTLAISGGLDSRLALVQQRFDFGYTYGPENSGDRPVARQYADCFARYEEYEFTAPKLLDEETPICDELFFGVSSWGPRLLSAYKYSVDKAGPAKAFFDGYLGDVFQRGNYLKFRQVRGNLLRLLPVFYRLGFSAEFLMRRRYCALDEQGLAKVLADFQQRTGNLDATDYQKVTYYEFFYGRGGRYVINGGNIVAGQMFTTIPFFCYKPVFEKCFAQNFCDAVQYKLLRKIWQKLPARFSETTSDAGVGPMTPYWFISIKNIFYRALVHYVPGYSTYVNEKPKG